MSMFDFELSYSVSCRQIPNSSRDKNLNLANRCVSRGLCRGLGLIFSWFMSSFG